MASPFGARNPFDREVVQPTTVPVNNDPYEHKLQDSYALQFGLPTTNWGRGKGDPTVLNENNPNYNPNLLRPSYDLWKKGIDVNEIYKNAGLRTAGGSYSGINNSWVADHNDTLEARDKRVQALIGAGMPEHEAMSASSLGFIQLETDADNAGRLMSEYIRKNGMANSIDVWNHYQATEEFDPTIGQQKAPALQPFQQTQQYQNYMNGGYGQPQQNMQQQSQSQNFMAAQQPMQQPRAQLQSFQPQQYNNQSGGLLSTNSQPQQNQYGLLSPYAFR